VTLGVLEIFGMTLLELRIRIIC